MVLSVHPAADYTQPHQCTVNGKKIEIAVKQIVSGVDVKPSGAVANPESLKLYYKYRNLGRLTQAKL